MAKGKRPEITLPKLDDLFSSQESKEEESLSKIRDIPLEMIDDFPDHPFKVKDDEDMMSEQALLTLMKEEKPSLQQKNLRHLYIFFPVTV